MTHGFPEEVFAPWQATVNEKLLHANAKSCAELLSRFPGVPYKDVVASLDGGIAPIALTTIYLREAKRTHTMRRATADSFVRELNEGLPGGWNTGVDPASKAALSFSFWLTSLIVQAGMPELQPIANRIWQALRSLQPPTGWRPSDADDPLIRLAFDSGWPELGEAKSRHSDKDSPKRGQP